MKIRNIKQGSDEFPEKLKNIIPSPKQLYVLGNLEPLASKTALSVVGSRAVTPYGRQITTKLVNEVAKHGVAIISGMALGIDGLAHQAALDSGGYTVAVLACGLDRFYPSTHHQLAEQILSSGGAIISEYPEGTEPFQANFIERNRIVSGLADGVLIVEASERSGTLHTANFALDQGKTVMAVPGNITSATSIGTNNLIKTGATPITSANDILFALKVNEQTALLSVIAANPQEEAILSLIRKGTSDINELQIGSQMPADKFNQTLTMLEITGKVRPLGAGHWSIN